MANDEGEVIGLTLAKINGQFNVKVRNARWGTKRPLNVIATGGGNVDSKGFEQGAGSFDEVIPQSGAFNWRALSNFTIQIYDQPTQKIQIAAFEGCNWEGIDGNNDLNAGTSGKSITWKSKTPVAV